MLPHGEPMCQVAKNKPRPRWKEPLEGNPRATLETCTRNLCTPSQSLAFCLAQRLPWSSVWHLGQHTACNNIPTSLTSLEKGQLCLYKKLEDRASGWVFLVCGSWYILILLSVCRKFCIKIVQFIALSINSLIPTYTCCQILGGISHADWTGSCHPFNLEESRNLGSKACDK
jgi:hypothetical protein